MTGDSERENLGRSKPVSQAGGELNLISHVMFMELDYVCRRSGRVLTNA
jgi:hypothetical protein